MVTANVVNAVEPREFARQLFVYRNASLTKSAVSGTLYGSAFLGMAKSWQIDGSLLMTSKKVWL